MGIIALTKQVNCQPFFCQSRCSVLTEDALPIVECSGDPGCLSKFCDR